MKPQPPLQPPPPPDNHFKISRTPVNHRHLNLKSTTFIPTPPTVNLKGVYLAANPADEFPNLVIYYPTLARTLQEPPYMVGPTSPPPPSPRQGPTSSELQLILYFLSLKSSKNPPTDPSKRSVSVSLMYYALNFQRPSLSLKN